MAKRIHNHFIFLKRDKIKMCMTTNADDKRRKTRAVFPSTESETQRPGQELD